MSMMLRLGRCTAATARLTARFPMLRWLPSITLAGVFVLTAASYQRGVDAERAAWGETADVYVADADHEPGDAIRATLTPVPVALAPDAPIGELVGDETARQRIGGGEVVTIVDVSRGGPLGALPDGWRTVAVRERPASGAAIGDRVDVATEGIVLVEGGVVVDRFDDVTLVGVPADAAALVAFADTTGVALLRSGLSGPASP